eukprot:CAMPEP_0175864682 /NCGR_PEP_ID=MMETSP0107_2-20121207/33231_1 /TAXON_ID=195067 ORGANISM="Goniomonas pacifica, Strain CCMP1869" /NCGR_SAMPLE_ID=MMETSP0107_2 /ASSEMBLY_ACC=CAM_ASM_000203 /LENGTH=82 /DNA_ID=CAMNT_0017182009 /DNA_START=36 /DNA_END=281 /DNA_ORIENTATION=-
MFTLLQRDGLSIPYAAFQLCTCALLTATPASAGLRRLALVSVAGAVAVHMAGVLVLPPPGKPDIFSLLHAVYSFVHFAALYL